MALILPFQLPNELLLSALLVQYPCREAQIRSLSTLVSPYCASPKNIVIYGLEATGKSSVTGAVLSVLSVPDESLTTDGSTGREKSYNCIKYAIVKSTECITGRHLLESTVGVIARALGFENKANRCENLAQLAVRISNLLERYEEETKLGEGQQGTRGRFVLVFDGVDRQRDAPPTLLQALARMAEIIPRLTTIFIITSPRPHFLHVQGVPHIHFPAYVKAEALQILSQMYPSPDSRETTPVSEEDDGKRQKEMKDLWTRFCSAVWDTLSKHSGRDILSFHTTCSRLWPSFIAPILDGTFGPKDFTRLLVSKRFLFQDERVLVPSIVSNPALIQVNTSTVANSTLAVKDSNNSSGSRIASQLPYFSRLLLIAAYLASYTPPRHDVTLFSKSSSQSHRRKRGGGAAKSRLKPSKHRKISGKLLGPQSFVLERMLAIFHAVLIDSGGVGAYGKAKGKAGQDLWIGTAAADIPVAIATLASLRLVVRAGLGGDRDVLDAVGKWKVNIGWEVVRSVARTVGVEVEDFLID